MQIYTKIFIGMAIGILIGMFLGPNSIIGPQNTLVLDGSKQFDFYQQPSLQANKINFPSHIPSSLTLIEDANTDFYTFTTTITNRHILAMPSLGEAGQHISVSIPRNQNPKLIWGPGTTILKFLSPIGDIFMRLIKMLIVPLVFCSLLVGVASLGDVRQLGRIGGKTLGFFLVTTVLAITIGIVSANIIQPGNFVSEKDQQALAADYQNTATSKVQSAAEKPSAMDNIISIVPKNPIESMAAKSPNMLQIIFFAIFCGIACTLVPQRLSAQIVSLLDKINDAMIMMIHMTMYVAPYGVCALVAKVVGTSGWSVLGALVIYSAVVIGGLAIHAVFVYSSAVKFIAKLKITDFLRVIRPAQLIAFSTSSSAAALPLSLETAKESMNISNHTSSFVIPLGTTVNMDGTALYQGVAALFIAQVFGIDLSLADQLNIILTATLASIGAAAVPGVGMITLAMVLTAVGIPTIGVALILGVDRILDMFRSAVNCTGNLAATAVIAASEGEHVHILSQEEDIESATHGLERRLDVPQHPYNPEGDTISYEVEE